jgi:hypothetical protein
LSEDQIVADNCQGTDFSNMCCLPTFVLEERRLKDLLGYWVGYDIRATTEVGILFKVIWRSWKPGTKGMSDDR